MIALFTEFLFRHESRAALAAYRNHWLGNRLGINNRSKLWKLSRLGDDSNSAHSKTALPAEFLPRRQSRAAMAANRSGFSQRRRHHR
jgi:hypothetical protein